MKNAVEEVIAEDLDFFASSSFFDDKIKKKIQNYSNVDFKELVIWCSKKTFSKPKRINYIGNKEYVKFFLFYVFTHPNAYEIIDYVVNTNIPLTIVTNGILVNTEKLSKHRGKNITFQISIDGTEEYHDDRRGKGNYKKTVENINKIRELGFFVNIYMTLDVNNYKSVPDILKMDFYDSATFMPVATAGAATLNEFKNSKELDECIETIYKATTKKLDIKHRCNIFPKGISINYEGYVFPCSIARDYKLFPFGNINNDSLENIIQNFVNSDQSDMFFDYKGNNQIKKCVNCPKNKECNQGCRMRAFKFNGDILSHDPFCCKIFNGEYKDISYGNIYWGGK